jgi:hypothetical protein
MYTPIDVAPERITLHESLKDAGAGDDERSMALRPSQRQPKKTSEEEAAPDGLDQIDQFFSNDPRPDHPSPDDARPDEAAVPQIPAVTMPDHSGAGWYPDATDPRVMRYWDGSHLTGQTMQVEPTEPRGDEPAESAPDTATVEFEGSSINEASWFTDPQAAGRPQTAPFVGESPAGVGHNEEGVATPPPSSGQLTPGPGVPPAVAVTSLNPDHGPPELPVSKGETWTAMRGDGGNLRAPLGKVDSREAPPSHAGADVTGNWAEKTEQAVARARAAGTPEAWQAAAQAAVVVSELARTMEAEVSALQAAEQTGKAAQEAEEAAKVAAQAAADAKQTVQRTVAAAHEAEEAAKVAAQAAADAKQTAEQTAQAAPQVAEVARVAAQVAADAKHKAEGLEAIVATARAADTPAAWSEALGLAAVAMETREELVSGA